MLNTKSSSANLPPQKDRHAKSVMLDGEATIVRKVSVTDTLLRIPVGHTARYRCRDMYLQSVRAAACRLAQNAGHPMFSIQVFNGGEEFEVTRIA